MPKDIERTLEVVSDADLPAVVVDPTTRAIIDANPRFEELFDRPASDLQGTPCRELVRAQRRREVRELVALLSFGSSRPPLRLHMRIGEEEWRPTTWVGIPTVCGQPVDPIVIVVRPTGGPVGKPVGPPSSLDDDETLDRIPPRDRVRDRRGDAEKSRSLWERNW